MTCFGSCRPSRWRGVADLLTGVAHEARDLDTRDAPKTLAHRKKGRFDGCYCRFADEG